MTVSNKIKDDHEDLFLDWVAQAKFDEFATFKDNYERDFEWYVESNLDELWCEYFDLNGL